MSDTDPWVGVASAIRPRSKVQVEMDSAEKDGLQGLEEDEAEEGKRTPKKLQDPRLPSQEEIDEPSLTHLPYRLVQTLRAGQNEGGRPTTRTIAEKTGCLRSISTIASLVPRAKRSTRLW